MFIRLRQPIVIFGNLPSERGQIISIKSALAKRLIQHRRADPAGITDASDDPELEELKEKARRLGQDADWDLKEPGRSRRQPVSAGSYPRASQSANFGSKFGYAISAACERVSLGAVQTVKQHTERVRKEASRYRPMQRRQRTHSE